MPIYNGENYVREALDSILAQTFRDFELIISDNASTDATKEICRSYAAKDPRIRYCRAEKNLGGAYNHNRVFELSTGRYFKWAAHDDVCAPEFLERCVEILDREPSVVLCYPRTIILDQVNDRIIKYDDGFHFISPKPHQRYKRYHERVRYGHESHPVFGVNSDRVLLGELVLHGRFYEVPEFLFFKRNHADTSVNLYLSYRSRVAWFDPAKKGKLQLTRWRMLFEYLRAINRANIAWREKLLCDVQMGKWSIWYAKWLARDVVKALVWPVLSRSLKAQSRREIAEVKAT
jgi:glycosyltransferase involved in cell wall biosynthesis